MFRYLLWAQLLHDAWHFRSNEWLLKAVNHSFFKITIFFFGISSTFWDIWIWSSEKTIFAYSLTFHNTWTFKMLFFNTSHTIDSCSNYRILGSCKLGSSLGSTTHNYHDLYWKLVSIVWLSHHLLWLVYSRLIYFLPMFLLNFTLSIVSLFKLSTITMQCRALFWCIMLILIRLNKNRKIQWTYWQIP